MPKQTPAKTTPGNPPNNAEEDYMDETIQATNLHTFPCDEDLVIAGMSGKVAGCHNFSEFEDALYSKKDVLTTTEKAGRYENGLFGNQAMMGAIPDNDKFDASFFNMYPYMANSSDPSLRLLLEHAYEVLIDAGESMESLQGTRTSVIVGALPSDSPECSLRQKRINNYSYIGYVPCHLANRISFTFDFKGPSFTIDSACSSSLAAIETAVNHIRLGYSDNAIVASANLVQNPYSTLSATHVGMLCSSGYCKAFDKDGDGFVRADGNMAILIRKRSQAKRVYGTIMHLRGNNDGFTREGISFPSGDSQATLFRTVYDDLGIDPNIVKFAECHGPGTPVGDSVEVDALAKYLCSSRSDPLYVGSVKTTIAHPEGAAGLASVCKCLIGLNNMQIPPNMHFNIPNPNIRSLFDGRVKVTTEALPVKSGIISVSSFGVGGTNYNLCLRAYKNENRPSHPASKVPRLFLYGCRTEEAASGMREEARKYAHNVEYQALLEASSNQSTTRAPYRFYEVLNTHTGKYSGVQKQIFKKRQVWLSFSGMGTHWVGMGRTMMKLDIFRESVEKSAAILKKDYDLDLLSVIYNATEEDYQLPDIVFVTITVISIALYDLINAMGIEWDYCFGHSLGETAAGYADGSLTFEEAVICSYWRGRAAREHNSIPGKMIAAGMDWDEAVAMCPKDCWVACHNYKTNVTIAGLVEPTEKLCADLVAKGYFAREINTLGRAFHCPCTHPMVPTMRKELTKCIEVRKKSSRWLSTSIPQSQWDLEESNIIGPEYFIRNLVNPVLYYEVATLIPENAVVIEMSPNAIFFGTLKKTVPPNVTVLSCMKGNQTDNVEYFHNQMGQAYLSGVNMRPLGLYQPVQFPVPKGTPFASTMVNKMWDHSASWYTPRVEDDRNAMRGNECLWEPDMTKTEDMYLKSYVVNEQNIYPPGGYLLMAWKTIAHLMKRKPFEEMAVVMENVTFLDTRVLNPDGETVFTCSLQTSGAFEIREGNRPVARGFICPADDEEFIWPEVTSRDLDLEECVWSSDSIYAMLDTQGRTLTGEFRNIVRANHDFTNTDVQWGGQWEARLDAVLQCAVQSQGVAMPGRVDSISRVDIRPVSNVIDASNSVCQVKIDPVTNILVAANIVLQSIQCTFDDIQEEPSPCIRRKAVFVPFIHAEPSSKELEEHAAGCHAYKENSVTQVKKKLKVSNGSVNSENKMENYFKSTNKDSFYQFVEKMSDVKSSFTSLADCLNTVGSVASETYPDISLCPTIETSILEPCLDIVVTNTLSSKLNIIELDVQKHGVSSKIVSTLAKNPQINFSCTVAANTDDATSEAEELGMTFVNWGRHDDKENAPKTKYNLIVAKNALSNGSNIEEVITKLDSLLAQQGFVLLQEAMSDLPLATAMKNLKFTLRTPSGKRRDIANVLCNDAQITEAFHKTGFDIIYKRSDSVLYNVYLLRKSRTNIGENVVVNVTDQKGSWLPELQKSYTEIASRDDDSRLWVFSDTLKTGMMGLLQSLRNESGGSSSKLRCVIKGNAVNVDMSMQCQTFQTLVRKDLVVNECRDGVWGVETAVGFEPETDVHGIPTTNAYLSMDKAGDLNSFSFLATPPSAARAEPGKKSGGTISVYYAGISHRDVRVAMGQVSGDNQGIAEELSFGVDFVGVDSSGQRVMGFSRHRAIGTEIEVGDVECVVPIPRSVSMETAGGTLLAYSTALYVFRILTKVKPGQSVLIHSGESDVGLAAISLALHHGLHVFTTVASEDGRSCITKNFPKLTKDNIAASTDNAFGQKFLTRTKGKGVNIILNTLIADKAMTSLRLVTKGGHFIDLVGAMTSITGHSDVSTLLKDKSILEVDMHYVITSPDMRDERKALIGLLQDGYKEGFIRPIPTTVFGFKDAERAFQTAASTSVIGKVLIEFRPEETKANVAPKPIAVLSKAKTTCHPVLSYIVIGGLDAFGLEVAHWLTQRGCTKLLLTGRTDVASAYQRRRVEMVENQGVNVTTMAAACTTQREVLKMLNEAQKLGNIGGIVIMPQSPTAIPFKDAQPEDFRSAMGCQMAAISLLDSASRDPKFGQHLHLFCTFTSLAGLWAQGNLALANFNNSFVERAMTKRKDDLLPAKVIQIGSVADVDVGGSRVPVVGGTHPQNMISLLKNLDEFLNSPHEVLSCYVLTVKKLTTKTAEGTPVQLAIAMELGVPDFSKYDQSSALMDLGMDSIVGNQAVTMLANRFNITIDGKSLTQLTVEELGQLG